MAWRLAVDIGGTFTDIVALEESTGRLRLAKVPSTPRDPAEGFINGIAQVMRDGNIAASDIAAVFHGTTVATNAILERKYAPLGLVITRGYREALEVARQTVPGEFGDITWWIKPERVVPLELVREVEGRLDVNGRELVAIDEEAVRALAAEYRALGIDAIAVSLLHSYRNPAHEQRVRELIREVYPDCFISISSDILREYREYERTNTTCLNTALMPLLSRYHDKLADHLRRHGIGAPFYIMRSSGGLAQAEEISRQPITAALSGPAAGVISACHFARLSGFDNLICFDVGGTSADICLVENGTPRMLTEGRVDIYDVKTPMIDIHTVGAGGGSIAWLAGGRSLKVGPDSAGADPGPACYGRGGDQATVTDANAVLGRLTGDLAGGGVALDRARAEAVVEPIANALGLDLVTAADGILRIAIENMAAGIRTVSVKRGRDPRDYVLVAFGGAGPLHACYLADWLGLRQVLVPPSPGVTSAYGLLLTDVRIDLVHTDVQREDRLDRARVGSGLAELEERVRGRLSSEGFGPAHVALTHFVDLRYGGQAYEIRTPLEESNGDAAAGIDAAFTAFHAAHRDLYGYSYEGREVVDLVNVGVTGLGLLERPRVPAASAGGASPEAALRAHAEVYFPQSRGRVSCPVYSREKLRAGNIVEGPAIVEQYDSTTVINPGWHGRTDEWGSLVLSRR
ncbi:MAG: hydantoinase/oxoprolinase family protein [Gammaproteobacteria bacterium]